MDKGLEMQRSTWCLGNEKWSVVARVWGGKENGRCGGWLGRHNCERLNASLRALDLILRQQKIAQGFNQRRT